MNIFQKIVREIRGEYLMARIERKMHETRAEVDAIRAEAERSERSVRRE